MQHFEIDWNRHSYVVVRVVYVVKFSNASEGAINVKHDMPFRVKIRSKN